MILFPQKDFPYAIDRKPGDICLADLTRCAIDFLQQKGNGFFLIEAYRKLSNTLFQKLMNSYGIISGI